MIGRGINLCFHGVGVPQRPLEPGEAAYWVDGDLFRGVLDLVVDRPDVRLSFDDGNASDAVEGLPALVERGLTARFFVLAGRLDQPGSLSTGQLPELVAAGMTVGSHGMHHRSWRRVSAWEAEDEFTRAREVIADAAGVAVTTAACPLGEYDRWVLRRLREEGYTQVMTSDRSPTQTGQWLQPRFSVRAQDTLASVRALLDQRTGPADRLASRGRILAKSLR